MLTRQRSGSTRSIPTTCPFTFVSEYAALTILYSSCDVGEAVTHVRPSDAVPVEYHVPSRPPQFANGNG